jgi:hypothetical protein
MKQAEATQTSKNYAIHADKQRKWCSYMFYDTMTMTRSVLDAKQRKGEDKGEEGNERTARYLDASKRTKKERKHTTKEIYMKVINCCRSGYTHQNARMGHATLSK